MTPEQVARLLPGLLQESIEPGSPLEALVCVMADQRSGVERQHEDAWRALSPWHAPPQFLSMLAQWVGLEPTLAASEAQARALIEEAVPLWRHRGTEAGMLRLLELATGLNGFYFVPGSEAFSLVLVAPSEGRAHDQRLRRALRQMKPAAVRLEGIRYAEQAGETDAQ